MTTVSLYEDPISSEMAEATEVFPDIEEWSLIDGGFLLLQNARGETHLINASMYAAVHFDEHLEWWNDEDEEYEEGEEDDDDVIESPFY